MRTSELIINVTAAHPRFHRSDKFLSMLVNVNLLVERDLFTVTVFYGSKLKASFLWFAGKEFFVGVGKHTNEAGARAVAAAFPEFPCTPIKVKYGELCPSIVFLKFYARGISTVKKRT